MPDPMMSASMSRHSSCPWMANRQERRLYGLESGLVAVELALIRQWYITRCTPRTWRACPVHQAIMGHSSLRERPFPYKADFKTIRCVNKPLVHSPSRKHTGRASFDFAQLFLFRDMRHASDSSGAGLRMSIPS